ncbi:hypothetical protein [Enterobacter cloacae]|uniref:hypothetical protein n=1 Tax=Enterobacter cloacae TaxID=550 RepID=UPI003877F7B8
MDYKKLNMALFITVLVLLSVTVFAFLKVLFSDTKTLEWGSVSDFISSVSTFGTLLVAFFAYKAAPQWIKQKRNEEGFKHVSTMLEDYDSIIMKIEDIYFRFICIDPALADSKSMIQEIDIEVIRVSSLSNKLDGCKRWNIEYPKQVRIKFTNLNLFYAAGIEFAMSYDKDNKLAVSNVRENLTTMIRNVRNDLTYFNQDIEKIFNFPK